MSGRGHAARMGGDEFAVLCEGVHDEGEARALAEDLKSAFAAPFVVDRLTVHLQCASGFALFPASADQADELIRLADVALYRAKASGRGGYGVFDKNDERAAQATALEQALHRAVANDEIAVFFQPIVDLATGGVSGFELLARWTDAWLGAIEPSVFISAAESIGLIHPAVARSPAKSGGRGGALARATSHCRSTCRRRSSPSRTRARASLRRSRISAFRRPGSRSNWPTRPL